MVSGEVLCGSHLNPVYGDKFCFWLRNPIFKKAVRVTIFLGPELQMAIYGYFDK
jgi:hypothetical protein